MTDLLPGLNSLTGILMIVVGFGFIIFIHELGHFLAAKMVGIKVTQFAIGFGPAIVAWRKGIGFRPGSTEADMQARLKKHLEQAYESDRARPGSASHTQQETAVRQIDQACAALGLGETEYRLNWLPLGGYVKMLGQEDMDAAAQSEDDRAFNRKPAWARAIVIVAGVTMNLVFGLIFFIVAFLQGVEFPPALVGGVAPGSPAAQAQRVDSSDPGSVGLEPGDRIIRIDDTEIHDFLDLAVNTALARADHTLTLQVLRDGHDQPLIFKAKPRRDPNLGLLSLGISQTLSPRIVVADPGTLPLSWQQAGVAPGMRVIQAGDEPITLEQFHRFSQAVIRAKGEPVPLLFADDTGQSVQATLQAWPTLTPALGEETSLQLLGLEPVVRISRPSPGKPAARAGVLPGDLLARLDGVDWPSIHRVPKIVQSANGRAIPLTVMRQGQLVELPAVRPTSTKIIGIEQAPALDETRISGTLPGSPFSSLNLPEGSRILAIGDTPVSGFGDMQRALARAVADSPADQDVVTVAVVYQLNITGQPQYTRHIAIDKPWQEKLAQAGWMLPYHALPFAILRQPVKADTPLAAARLGVRKTHVFMMQTYLTLVRLFQQTVPVSGLHGPVGIVHAGTLIARDSGWPYVLFFFGIISVNLVVINLLPIPIADGGLLLFLLIEKIKGSPLPPAILTGATYVGLALIGGLFLMVTYFDLARLFTEK